ncbi:MAG: deoxyribodipyrimidine photo-lyase [Simkaniaceae bacterium]|nr:deoxyribodipyrimidine photo-lyase [Candidatus Sacchlamyda saccharinae]
MSVGVVWHQTDLRTEWNPALSEAIKENDFIVPLFILDEGFGAASLWWLKKSLESLARTYKNYENTLVFRKGDTLSILEEVFRSTSASKIYFNIRYTPTSLSIQKKAFDQFPCALYLGNHLVNPKEILTKEGKPYSVFTPFYKACLKEIQIPRKPTLPKKIPGIKDLKSDLFPKEQQWMKKFEKHWTPGREGGLISLKSFVKSPLKKYAIDRDFPAVQGTSRLSPHLHFGELSPPEIWLAAQSNDSFTRQLIWREFGTYFLYHNPDAEKNNWNQKFNEFQWENNVKIFEKWAHGKTGYPIVDAAMRQLWETGWMHNRLRMIVASFLVKDLLIDWKMGERWFWDTLVDADLGNNILGWQWTAGCGPDAAPYFRVFNPVLQGQKFDPDGKFVRQYVPELSNLPTKWIHCPWEASNEVLQEANIELGKTYPKPLVDHQIARKEALKRFEKIKGR